MPKKSLPHTLFRDPVDPTPDEVHHWAYMARAFAPSQDFELIIIHNPALDPLVFGCAADTACPKQRFFLGCLYVLVGDAVRSQWKTFPRHRIERLIQQGLHSNHPDVECWATRAQALLNDPTGYTYAEWGLGSRFVYADSPTSPTKTTRKR